MLIYFTWTTYFEIAVIALIAYYLFIGLYFYSGKWLEFINGKLLRTNQQRQQDTDQPVAEEYVGEEPGQALGVPGNSPHNPDIQETELLISRIKATIDETPRGPHSQQKVIIKLRTLFLDFPDVKTSPYREAINELTASQCKESGTALVTVAEVDSWWNE